MSKERELLKELITRDMVKYYYPTLVKKVEELLAQPEQEPEQEQPVAWMWANEALGGFYFSNIGNPGWVPLYTAQKREPLSDEAICQILLKKEWKGFVDLVRIIEKAHGIGVDDE